MDLRQQLLSALQATPVESVRRREILRSVLETAGGDDDIRQAIAQVIADHERQAATYGLAGNPGMAAAERSDIDVLRAFLRPAEKQGGAPLAAPRKSEFPRAISRPRVIIAATTLVALAVVAFFVLRFSAPDTATAKAGAGITLFKDDRTLGNPNAPVTVLEYAAPTCPFCARFMRTVMPGIKKDYIDTGKVFYVFRVYPLQPADGAVEGIARCLRPERYFPYIEGMFRSQPQWDPDGYQIPDVRAAIVKLARREGVDAARAEKCMADPKQMERINQVAWDGQVRYDIRSTPTFIINGEVLELVGGRDPDKSIRLRIDSLLAKS